MHLTIGQKLTFAFAAAVAILIASGIVASRNTRELVRTAEMMGDSHEALAQLYTVSGAAVEADGAGRAFLLAGEERFRRDVAAARVTADQAVRELRRLTDGDHRTARSAARLDTAVATYFGSLTARLAAPSAAVADRAEARLAASAAAVRQFADSLRGAGLARLEARSAAARATADRAAVVVRFGLALTLVLAPLSFLILRHDMVVRRETEEALRASEARFRAAADGSLDAFYVLRAVREQGRVVDFAFVDMNARAESLLGRPRGQILGQRLCELLPVNRTAGFFERYLRVLERGTVLEEECEVSVPGVQAAWIHHQVVPLDDGVAITSRDVTDRKQQEEALRSLSLIDELTGLYNRRGFLTLAQQQLKLARRGHRDILLLFVDMDDFKRINDAHGHAVGDDALRRTSHILKKTFRDSDIVARLGGDEFVVLAADSSRDAGDIIVSRLRNELRERNERDGAPYRLSFSVGVARFDPDAPPSIEDLLTTADAMLYEQKRDRREARALAGASA
jgi:diguanylate cyclase (GGDEF)-like protein/PAS domain S-box-containing protein